ncbi:MULTISPECIES: MerR family transcriptional regulator [Methylomonas]|uniref:MerR family transcriptional regulator n=1 Tax=Methylomonas koyamae TaxID=702114 RepID=A0A177NA73_9GAMM|nr:MULTISPECIES: MerR family transcriptional regulator [Methylomonas]NJA04866.1 MerR family transcriptional regulator [Methylococcaceae bacterium WWC4]OAI14946.1 MerR family transcriptional regulator [Methylomonas koyamae]OHX35276.1 MerR family transcriptional regulator [Methylomonas sp. LWB]WGS87776.1 MerR family transcriptional regulator [Methylomonas sp. UP202]
MYSIKAITSLTGLTPETLRAWERRYSCITPSRTGTGRRYYSQQDLEKLTLLVNLTRNGHPISKIAGMDCPQLRAFQEQAAPTVAEPRTLPLIEQIVDALAEYRIERCEQLLKRALLASEPLDYARDVLLPALHKVGYLWEQGRLNIAQEHMFSSCVQRIVLTMVNNLHRPSPNNPSIMFATPSGEPHEFGILLCCLVASAQQYQCYYLGADLPAADIVAAAAHLRPDALVMGLVKTPPETATLLELKQILGASLDSKLWLGGSGADYIASHALADLSRCELIGDIDHFDAKIKQQRVLS